MTSNTNNTIADSKIHYNLYIASLDGNDSRVGELLAAGAEPDKYKNSLYGNTALTEAAFYGRDSTVSILIQHGAEHSPQKTERGADRSLSEDCQPQQQRWT